MSQSSSTNLAEVESLLDSDLHKLNELAKRFKSDLGSYKNVTELDETVNTGDYLNKKNHIFLGEYIVDVFSQVLSGLNGFDQSESREEKIGHLEEVFDHLVTLQILVEHFTGEYERRIQDVAKQEKDLEKSQELKNLDEDWHKEDKFLGKLIKESAKVLYGEGIAKTDLLNLVEDGEESAVEILGQVEGGSPDVTNSKIREEVEEALS